MTNTSYSSQAAGGDKLLPETLKSGDILVAESSGITVTLVGSSRKNEYGEKLFRLRYHPRKDGKWKMPGCTSSTFFSRDDMQGLGLVVRIISKLIQAESISVRRAA